MTRQQLIVGLFQQADALNRIASYRVPLGEQSSIRRKAAQIRTTALQVARGVVDREHALAHFDAARLTVRYVQAGAS